MWFLASWFKTSWLSDVASSAAGTVVKMARTFVFWLDTFIYKFIINLYELFETLCTARMLDNSLMKEISNRVGLILGLIMFFYIVFEFVKMMIDPDSIEDKQKGAAAIVKRTLIVIVMLGVSTFVFNTLYSVQRTVIKSNAISKLILPYSIETDKFGPVLSEELMYAFYQMESIDESSISDVEELDTYHICERTILLFRQQIIKNSRFDLGYKCLNEELMVDMGDNETQEVFLVDFNPLLSLIAGIVVAYFLIMYCISIGVRMVQLTVLEVISPMTIIAYLSPKQDNAFTKWSKMYISTYIDVFIRMAIVNFVVFLIATIFDTSGNEGFVFWESVGNPTGGTYYFFLVVIIIALLTFAKKAPDLIKDLLPSGASKLGFGISSPKKIFEDMAGAKAIKSISSNTIGLLGKKTLAGVDAKLHGQKFFDGFKTPKGKFGTWLGKQRETYLPNYNEVKKKQFEGSKEVKEIDTKWKKGVSIIQRLKRGGAVNHSSTTGADNAWDKVLNGSEENVGYYNIIFKSKKFIQSKMAVDKESSIEDDLRRLQQEVNLKGAEAALSGGRTLSNGETYTVADVGKLVKDVENQQKKVEGLKSVHESIRKQYYEDANTEDQYKFIKNNEINPASPGMNYETVGIKDTIIHM